MFRSDIDAVVIATPVRTHFQLAREALLHEKHVLVEKPLTASVPGSGRIGCPCTRATAGLMVGHTFEYNPAVNELRKLIQKWRPRENLLRRS